MIIYLLVAHTVGYLLADSQCSAIQNVTTIYITKGETIIINPQDYISGNSLTYTSDLQQGETIAKVFIQQSNIPDISLGIEILNWDIPISSNTNEWGQYFAMLSKEKYFLQKQYIYYAKMLTNGGFLDGFKQFSLRTYNSQLDCKRIVGCNDTVFLLDCHVKKVQRICIFNVISEQMKDINIAIPYSDGLIQSVYSVDDNNQAYYALFKIVTVKQIDHVKLFKINATDLSFTEQIIMNSTILGSSFRKISDWQIYDKNLYYLIDRNTIICQSLNGTIVDQWKLLDDFDKFSVFRKYDGSLTVLVGGEQNTFKIQLQSAGQVSILWKYGIIDVKKLHRIAHNDHYSIIQGSLQHNDIIYIFDQQDRLSSTAFYEIEYEDNQKLNFSFNPINNKLIQFDEDTINLFSFQTPLLYVTAEQLIQKDMNSITLFGQTQMKSRNCHYIMYFEILENEDTNVYNLTELTQFMVVLSKSVNTIDLNNLVYGADIKYQIATQAYNNEASFILFKNATIVSVALPEKLNTQSVLLNQLIILQSSTLQYLHIIQLNDSLKYLYIYLCTGSELKTTIGCIQLDATEIQPISIIKYFAADSYQSTTQFVYYLETVKQIRVCKYEAKLLNFTSQVNQLDSIVEVQKIGIYSKYYYIVLPNQIDFYLLKKNITTIVKSITMQDLIKQTSSEITLIVDVQTQHNDYLLYVFTDIGVVMIDPGLYRFGQITLLSIYKLPLLQYQQILLNQDYILVDQQGIYEIIAIKYSSRPYQSSTKLLQPYGYTIVSPIKCAIAHNSTMVHMAATKNGKSYILSYKLDSPEISSLYTSTLVDTFDIYNVISLATMDILLGLKNNEIVALRIYTNPQMIFSNPLQDQVIAVQFQGLSNSVQQLQISVLVNNNEESLKIHLNQDIEQDYSIQYYNSHDQYIKLDYFNKIINGTVDRWMVKCRDCPQDLDIVNYLDQRKNVTKLPGLNYIKHSVDFVFIQQESNLIIINSVGNITQIVPLPITSAVICETLASSNDKTSTKLVVSVCNDKINTEFYITSLGSSQPFAMGPFRSNYYVHSITHVRLLNYLLFVLDNSKKVVQVFNLQLDNQDDDQFKLVDSLDATDYVKENQAIVYFDVSLIDEDASKFIVYLLTDQQNMIILYSSQGTAFQFHLINIREFAASVIEYYPTNVIPLLLIVVNPLATPNTNLQLYNNVIIINQNYHSLELQFTYQLDEYKSVNSVDTLFIRAYLQYGYYQSTTKARVSEDEDGFLAMICFDPLNEDKTVLVVYDRSNRLMNDEATYKNSTLLGGLPIIDNSLSDSRSSILIDFIHQEHQDEHGFFGMILINSSEINSLKLSRDLNIKVNYNQFKDQTLYFTAENDFGSHESFSQDIFNNTGQLHSSILWALLIGLVCIVSLGGLMITKNRVRKLHQSVPIEDELDTEGLFS